MPGLKCPIPSHALTPADAGPFRSISAVAKVHGEVKMMEGSVTYECRHFERNETFSLCLPLLLRRVILKNEGNGWEGGMKEGIFLFLATPQSRSQSMS
ncbi:hypothetical protein L596_009291 [Steinernema carpocapsae]|uniref:Uncharacterized protein n=1 Tax=Steinernema carpocapsae TaxID=34508 RepID=A0A4V6A6N6_STECR|nr:hypothetical protein L596_009291 [Steinernema carpocapsae]